MLSKIKKLFNHFRNRTIVSRIKDYFALEKERKRILLHQKWSSLESNEYVIKKIQNNVKMRLYAQSKLSSHLIYEKFEQDEFKFVNRFLKKGDIFLDIGANVGVFSLIAGRKVRRKGKVYAFEPTKLTYERLLDNIALNKLTNVFPQQLALSNTVGTSNLTISTDGYDAWNSFGIPTGGSSFALEAVETNTLDIFCQKNQIINEINLIKIDVEGWEIPVLEGAKEVLMNDYAPVLIVEFTEQNAKNAGYSCKQLYELLQSYGYDLYIYDSKTNSLKADSLRDHYPYLNLIACKDIKGVQSRIA